MGYTNSPLVVYKKLSPNHSGQRTHSIDRITPHCVVGQLSAESICGCFTSTSRQASCNYGIGTDGRVSLCVEEKNRSWCSSSNANDQRAVTIECASDMNEPYAMNSAVYSSLIKLCTDICRRNGKKKLLWLGDKNKTLNYAPAADEMVLTVHRWFANKSCPGNWLYARMGDLAAKVTAALGGSSSSGMQASSLKNLSEAEAVAKIGPLFTANQKTSGILACVSMAQFILESGYGKSELAQNANNCFGMKTSLSGNSWSGSSWDGKSVYVRVSTDNDEQTSSYELQKNYYLNGFSFTEIAELLTEYGRKTKLGNTEWNPGTIAGVIANERHCGDVLARKTFTPNFLTHKSKKNNNDRTQYRQRDHHEAIVSREVYNAANHLRASRNYTRKNRPLPVLSVVDDGILRGYVPFDKDWTGFSAEEYREASESVMQEEQENNAEVMNRLNLSGYEVVRAQYFSTLQNPAMTISNGKLRFNTSCLKKFEDVEYVELLLNSVDRCVAIRPCEKGNPNAIHWGRLKEGRWCASTLGCRGLAKTLFDIMEWEEGLKYRFRGQFVEQGDNKLMLFELDEPEMIKIEEIVLPSKEEEAEGKTVKQMIYIFPPEWAGTFGQPITSIAQVGILQQEHYAGNWDVLRPAAEIKEMNTFTADGLNALLHEAEEIMEGWTDTNE